MKLTSPYAQSGLNVYDIRHHCDDPPLCYDFSNIDKFLSTPDVQKVGRAPTLSDRMVACYV